ncbi:hypothetical protein LOTGIDRAFT_165446 [Lottia gigantea]|uniref:PiggyBac transposable element-derived protein domain-containing protein n=1 Tax=Lottia gigantea TaxID=225164 RepID=V4A5V5_LOTGI|nr:hypothetical protein LOTGIDRAFT_165446 [Lottia gigantea]ESO88661.1 hypothetical protein LOTGIDRAFT_165446 [Lottia gigantea]
MAARKHMDEREIQEIFACSADENDSTDGDDSTADADYDPKKVADSSSSCDEGSANTRKDQIRTARGNRVSGCPLKTEKELKTRGTYDFYVENSLNVVCCRWMDTKAVTLMSSFVGPDPLDKCKRWDKTSKEHKEVDRPSMVKEYNAHMGGVDMLDAHLARCEPAQDLPVVNKQFPATQIEDGIRPTGVTRQSGKQYINSRGNIQQARSLKNKKDCTKCKFKCSLHITDTDRLKIFTEFWTLDDIEKLYFFGKTTVQEATKQNKKMANQVVNVIVYATVSH